MGFSQQTKRNSWPKRSDAYNIYFAKLRLKIPWLQLRLPSSRIWQRYMYVRYAQSLEPESKVAPHLLRQPLSENRFLSISPTSLPSIIFLLSVIRPASIKVSWKETGNITFVLPNPAYGKNPEVYNYIGQESALTIEKGNRSGNEGELYEFLLENRNSKTESCSNADGTFCGTFLGVWGCVGFWVGGMKIIENTNTSRGCPILDSPITTNKSYI